MEDVSMWAPDHSAYQTAVSKAFLLPRQGQVLISGAVTPLFGHAGGTAIPEPLSEDMEAPDSTPPQPS